ncbi:MAG: efflux RND transporter periplasmic adaptor subunit [Leptolyngbya sp. PLA1]|nr:efflux RND transporter periplasmic adaptor subunit [Leptolyngbya sp. PLA1]
MWKWLLIIVVILLLGCVGTGYWMQSTGRIDKYMKMIRPDLKPTEVRLSPVERGDLVRTVSAPGQIEPLTKVEVSAQVSARIIALPFRENARVKQGDVVVRLDARDVAALLDSAKAQLRSEEARLEGARASFLNAQLELNRKKELLSTRDVSQAEVDAAESEFLRAKSSLQMVEHGIEIAKADIRRAEKNLDNTTITAPFDGVITKLNAEVGETVVVGTLNNPGSVIMEIDDLTVMVLEARVDEANIAPLTEGQKARIFVNAYPERVFTGTVEKVGLKRLVDRDGTAYFETEILVDLPQGVLLRSGLTANADIEVETFRDVVRVPSQAVLDRSVDDLPRSVTDDNPLIDRTKKYAQVVYLLENGKAVARVVKTGASDLTDTVILAGLEPGALAITGPFKALQNLKHDQLVVEQAKKSAPNTPPAAEAAAKDAKAGA